MIVDDERLATEVIKNYIDQTPFLTEVGVYKNPVDALVAIKKEQVDLIFLDIQMPQLTGMQFMKLIPESILVILTTAYNEYALDGYEYDVVDYLLKPISFDRFYKAAEKAHYLYSLSHNSKPEQPALKPQQDFIFVRLDTRMVRINYVDILFIEGLKNYVSIYTTEKRFVTLQTLKSLEDQLPSSMFFRVHRSYIVSINHIDSVDKHDVYIKDKAIPIGESYSEALFDFIQKRKA